MFIFVDCMNIKVYTIIIQDVGRKCKTFHKIPYSRMEDIQDAIRDSEQNRQKRTRQREPTARDDSSGYMPRLLLRQSVLRQRGQVAGDAQPVHRKTELRGRQSMTATKKAAQCWRTGNGGRWKIELGVISSYLLYHARPKKTRGGKE